MRKIFTEEEKDTNQQETNLDTESPKILLPNDYFNYPNTFGQEGEDHFNISVYSRVLAGKVFAPEFHQTISYPGIGRFYSVFSLWIWLCWAEQSDEIRNLDSKKLKIKLKYYKRTTKSRFIPNFKCIIGYATWLKISNNKKFVDEIMNLDDNLKPFYYAETTQKIRIARARSDWFIPIVIEIIDAIKNQREPSFIQWATHPSAIGDAYLEGFLKEKNW